MTIEEVIQQVESVVNRYYEEANNGTLREEDELYATEYHLIREYVYNKPFRGESQLVYDLIDTAIVYGFVKGRESR